MATNQMRREAAKRKLANQQRHRAERARKRRQVATVSSAAAVVVIIAAVVLLTTRPWAGKTDTPAAGTESAAPTASAVTPGSIPTAGVPLPARPTPLPATVDCSYPAGGTAAKPVTSPPTSRISARGTAAVTLQTNAGTIPLTLDRALAPCAVNSFVSLAKQGYFDATSCHRLTTEPGLQVLQCGDPTGSGSGGPGYTFDDETFAGLSYGRGLLAMPNAGTNTNGSQFFMIYGDAQLPPKYTVFGSISPDGLQVLDKIARAGHDGSFDPSPGGGKPIQPVEIQRATVTG